MDRREFAETLTTRMIALAGGLRLANPLAESAGWAAATLSEGKEANAGAVGGPVKYPGQGVTLEGYLARPASGSRHPAVLLIHATNGLDERVRDVAHRYAEAGFVALAVDPLSRHGGIASFASPDAARDALATPPPAHHEADVASSLRYLQAHPSVLKSRIRTIDCSQDG